MKDTKLPKTLYPYYAPSAVVNFVGFEYEPLILDLDAKLMPEDSLKVLHLVQVAYHKGREGHGEE